MKYVSVIGKQRLTSFDHLLNCTSWVDFHSIQVVESIDFCCIFAKFLTEGVRQVVSGIGRLSKLAVSSMGS